jgi:hypothetical protein
MCMLDVSSKSRPMRLVLLVLTLSLSVLPATTAQAQRVIDRIDLHDFEPRTMKESRLTNQSYVPGRSFVDGSEGVTVVNNASGALSFLSLGDWSLKGGLDVDQKTGRGYTTLFHPFASGIAVGFIDASGTELNTFEIFGFRPEERPVPPAQPLIATNEVTGHVFLLGDDGAQPAVGIFDPSIQQSYSQQLLGLVIVPLPGVAFFSAPGIAVNSQTNQVYVPAQTIEGQSVLVVIDAATASVVQTVIFGEDFFFPLSLAVNETTNRIYVTGNGLTSIWAVAEVNGADYSIEVIPTGEFQPYDIAISEPSDQVLLAGNGPENGGEVRIIDAVSRTTRSIPLGSFTPYGVSINPATGNAYVAGIDFGPDFGTFVLAIGEPVCDAEPTTVGAIRTQVLGLPTSEATIDDLVSSLDAAARSLGRGDNESARLAMTRFIRRLVEASNLAPSDPNHLDLTLANDLVCSGSNVLIGVQLP